MTFDRRSLILTVALTATLPRASGAQVDLNIDSRRLQQEFVARSALVQDAIRRDMNAEISTLIRQKDDEIRQKKQLQQQIQLNEAERQQVRRQLAGLLDERDALINQWGLVDPVFKAALDAFRSSISALTEAPSPAERDALSRYAAGDKRALDDLGLILNAEAAATEAALVAEARLKASMQTGKKLRGYAAMVLDERNRGEKTTPQAIEAWQQAAKFDALDAWTWIELTRLFLDAGRAADARAASENAVRCATGDERLMGIALTEAGAVLMKADDLAEAQRRFDDSVRAFKRRVDANPDDMQAQRDLRVSQSRLGEVLVRQDKRAEARLIFEALLPQVEQVASANPRNVVALSDLSVVLHAMGDVLQQDGDARGSLSFFNADLSIARRLAADAPTAMRLQDVALSLARIGELLASAESVRALPFLLESLQIFRRLAREDAGNANWQTAIAGPARDLRRLEFALEQVGDFDGLIQLGDGLASIAEYDSARIRASKTLEMARAAVANAPLDLRVKRVESVSQAKLGEVLARAGDLMGAQTQFEESLATAREVARLWPARSPDGIRTVRTVLLSLGKVLTARGELADALERLEDSLALAQQIATRSPSAVAQRDVIENHVALARLRGGEAHWAEALTLAEALKASGDLSDAELEEIRSHVRKR